MRFVRTCAQPLLLCALMSVAQAAAELYDNDGNAVTATTPLTARVPVLFVHGHGPADSLQNPHYQRNFWVDHGTLDIIDLLDLTSFKTTLAQNPGLDIQPYYIRFADPSRSIVEDAREIGEAVDLIIARHNPDFAAANPNIATTDPSGPPPVQVVIIAFSKGTISARQYLQSLQIQVSETGVIPLPPPLPAPRPHYRPVSEFIAISPPNHGLADPPASWRHEPARDPAALKRGSTDRKRVRPTLGHCRSARRKLHREAQRRHCSGRPSPEHHRERSRGARITGPRSIAPSGDPLHHALCRQQRRLRRRRWSIRRLRRSGTENRRQSRHARGQHCDSRHSRHPASRQRTGRRA